MSRFNKKSIDSRKTENLAGGEAFKQSDKLHFISTLLTSFVKNEYYRSADDTINSIKTLIQNINDKTFAAKASIYARTEFGMRSITHVTAGEIAKHIKGEQWTKRYFDKVVYRPDDILEIMSYYMNNYGKPLPNSMKKGLRQSFNKFNGYQLAKYKKDTAKLSLVDAVNLLRPKPVEKNKEALKLLVEGKLKSTDTWEAKLTKAGQVAKTTEEKEQLKADAWKDLIIERKIGYFALLRNLRNILSQAPELVDDACKLLVDEKLIKKSLVLPFRYVTARDEIMKISSTDSRKILVAIDKALDISTANVPKFKGKTLVAIDISGSMCWGSTNDNDRPINQAALLGAILAKSNNADVIQFKENAKYKNYNPNDTTTTLVKKFTSTIGGGTNFNTIFNTADKAYDRIIILSDMEAWMGYNNPKESFKRYKQNTGANPHIYTIDLTGHGTMQFPENSVYSLAGFSEKIFNIMKLLETDKKALINTIESIEL